LSALSGTSFHFDHIRGVLEHLVKIASNFNITIDDDLREKALEETLSHYYDHICGYNVRVTGIDPYKFASWSGMYLFGRIDDPNMIAATITTLRRYLKIEGKDLDDIFCQKLLVMAYNDAKKDTIAIGKNGLYMSFRTASELKIAPTA